MKDIKSFLSTVETTETINGIDCSYILPSSEKKTYIYLHGLFGDKNSSKAKQLAFHAATENEGSIRFSFRGNGKSISDNFGFEDMSLSSMVEDLVVLFEKFEKRGVNLFSPVASSLGASALLYFLQKNPKYIASIEKIYLLAPSIEFAKNRKRLRKKRRDNRAEEKWKSQGYLKSYHYANKATEKLGYTLFKESLDADLISFLQNINIPVMIFAGKKDELIDYNKLLNISKKGKYIEFVGYDDGHRLKESFDDIMNHLDMS